MAITSIPVPDDRIEQTQSQNNTRIKNDIISGLSAGCSLTQISEPGFEGQWVSFDKNVLQSAGGAAFRLAHSARWMALERYLPWWPRPAFGHGENIPEGEYFMILWEREDGECGVALPLVAGDVRGILHGGNERWSVRVPGNDPLPDHAALLFVATGNDPLKLVRQAVEKIAERLKTFRLRTEKATPQWVDYLGWCTWDAFYKEVTAEKVLEGLASFKRGGCSPRFLILDDGWQDVKDNQLWSFGTHPERFPQGLKPLVDQSRADYGVKLFGVWHAFQGYWDGVHPEGKLAGQYQLIATEGMAHNMPDTPAKKRSLVHPDDIGRFYDDYHRFLKTQGVAMVKVDNQASLDHFCNKEVPPTATMRAYQYAFQDATQAHFQGESLHCMSNTIDAAYHLRSACVWRNSQDFFPAQPQTHAAHIFDNAFNAIWVQTFALPDWDMFQSGHAAGGFHAAARAISGGPVYVSDKPESHDFGLLSKLMLSDGRILRSKQPALPAREALFEDRRTLPRITKILNFNEVAGCADPIGVLGLFNCFSSEAGPEPVNGEYGAADVPDISASRFALYHHVGGHVFVAKSTDRFPIRLESLGYEMVTVSPLENGVALFGLIDKFNGSRALESACWISENELEVVLIDGGRVGWCSEKNAVGATLKAGSGDSSRRTRAGGSQPGSQLQALRRTRLAEASEAIAEAAEKNRSRLKAAPVEITSQGNLSWAQLPEGAPVTLLLRFE